MSKKTSFRTKVAVGTTLGALLAAGAATFFFTKTKAGKQAAKKIKGTVAELSKELSHRVATMRDMSQKKYEAMVEEIVDQYAKQRKVAKETVTDLKRDLKSHWKQVQKELKGSSKR